MSECKLQVQLTKLTMTNKPPVTEGSTNGDEGWPFSGFTSPLVWLISGFSSTGCIRELYHRDRGPLHFNRGTDFLAD